MRTEYHMLHNTRDLGGMKTSDGRRIRGGCLFRSGQLSDLDPADAEQLRASIRTIIDFRTDRERMEKPDTELSGVQSIHIPVLDSLKAGISREEQADEKLIGSMLLKPREAYDYMCRMYREFADEFCSKQFSRFISLLAEAEGGVLWHCTAGKDRAGIASVIVEEILGVPREAVMADYMATEKYLSEDIHALTQFVKRQAGTDSDAADESMNYLLGVNSAYIDSFYNTVSGKYGDMDGYLREALGVGEEMTGRLREKYLIP